MGETFKRPPDPARRITSGAKRTIREAITCICGQTQPRVGVCLRESVIPECQIERLDPDRVYYSSNSLRWIDDGRMYPDQDFRSLNFIDSERIGGGRVVATLNLLCRTSRGDAQPVEMNARITWLTSEQRTSIIGISVEVGHYTTEETAG